MTIQVELNPETEARLIVEAHTRALPLGEVAEQLLSEALAERSASRGRMSIEEVHRIFAALAEGPGRLPDLPIGCFSRESFYEGRSPFGRWRPW